MNAEFEFGLRLSWDRVLMDTSAAYAGLDFTVGDDISEIRWGVRVSALKVGVCQRGTRIRIG